MPTTSLPAAATSPPSPSSAGDEAEADDVSHIRSIFDPSTLVQRGFCAVARGEGRKAEEHKVYYEWHGSKDSAAKKLVFIMGLSNSSAAWHAQVPFFANLGYFVLVFDNLGVGHSTSPSHGPGWKAALTRYKTSEMARDVRELLDFLGGGWEKEVHVVGVSMGGMIAQELALLIPDRVSTLLLTSTTAGSRFVPALPSRKATSLIVQQSLGLQKTPEAQIAGIVDTLFPRAYLDELDGDGEGEGEGKTRREVLEAEFLHRYHLGRRQPLAGRMGQTAAVLNHYLSPARLHELGTKISRVAVIHGEEDELISVVRGKELARGIPNASLTLVPSAGHALPRQITAQYNEWIRANVEREG
ncbi:hypothetical protein JCM10213_001571 [Rhodosporidiobolus nylandii]